MMRVEVTSHDIGFLLLIFAMSNENWKELKNPAKRKIIGGVGIGSVRRFGIMEHSLTKI